MSFPSNPLDAVSTLPSALLTPLSRIESVPCPSEHTGLSTTSPARWLDREYPALTSQGDETREDPDAGEITGGLLGG
jgi:hypothetical protein